jgi:tetraprenyl-beta-curcumene synthase
MAGRLGRATRESVASVSALLRAVPLYWLRIFPTVRREVGRWRLLAAAIPDPELRRVALAKLEEEGEYAEGAAAFAILAARRHRHGVVRACVAYELLFDYLDGVGEREPALAANRRAHRALNDAVAVAPGPGELVGAEPTGPTAPPTPAVPPASAADGGYPAALAAVCRAELGCLPGRGAVAAALAECAARAGEGQSRNHAGRGGDDRALRTWAERESGAHPDLRWFEYAAASASPLGVFALLAAASRAQATAAQARETAAAYFPWVAATVWMLDSLVDRGEDARSGDRSYTGHYGSSAERATRMAELIRRAAADLAALPDAARQRLMLHGLIALYLTRAGAAEELNRTEVAAVRRAAGPGVAPFLAMLRLRHAAARRPSVCPLRSRGRPACQ